MSTERERVAQLNRGRRSANAIVRGLNKALERRGQTCMTCVFVLVDGHGHALCGNPHAPTGLMKLSRSKAWGCVKFWTKRPERRRRR